MSLARICRSVAKVAGAKVVGGGIPRAFPKIVVRHFATTYKDMPHMVDVGSDSDGFEEDPATITMSVLKDEIRQEMYIKHMEDPEVNSFAALSVAYGTTLVRTKAVIFLMQQRHLIITKDEARLWEMLGETPPVSENKYKAAPLFAAPPVLQELFQKFQLDESVPKSVLLAGYNESIADQPGKVPVNLTEEQLREAFIIILTHHVNMANVKAQVQREVEDIEEARMAGVNVVFKEAPIPFKTSKAFNALHHPREHRYKSFEDDYYPPLSGDFAAKRHEFNLLQRVVYETKAQLEHDMEYYERTYAVRSPEETVQELRTAALPAAVQFHTPPAPEAPLSRWKIAFQDLSQSAVPLTKNTTRVPDRTVIRTRKGELRYATPLEEGKLSWRVRPYGIDRGLAQDLPHHHARLIAPYLDMDKDEAQVKLNMQARREKRNAMLKEAGISRK